MVTAAKCLICCAVCDKTATWIPSTQSICQKKTQTNHFCYFCLCILIYLLWTVFKKKISPFDVKSQKTHLATKLACNFKAKKVNSFMISDLRAVTSLKVFFVAYLYFVIWEDSLEQALCSSGELWHCLAVLRWTSWRRSHPRFHC